MNPFHGEKGSASTTAGATPSRSSTATRRRSASEFAAGSSAGGGGRRRRLALGVPGSRRHRPAPRPAPARSRTRSTVGALPGGVAVGAGDVWVANFGDGTVSRIDPRAATSCGRSGRRRPYGIAVAGNAVWVSNREDDSIIQISANSNRHPTRRSRSATTRRASRSTTRARYGSRTPTTTPSRSSPTAPSRTRSRRPGATRRRLRPSARSGSASGSPTRSCGSIPERREAADADVGDNPRGSPPARRASGSQTAIDATLTRIDPGTESGWGQRFSFDAPVAVRYQPGRFCKHGEWGTECRCFAAAGGSPIAAIAPRSARRPRDAADVPAGATGQRRRSSPPTASSCTPTSCGPPNLSEDAKTPVILSIGPYFGHAGSSAPAGPAAGDPPTTRSARRPDPQIASSTWSRAGN